MKKAIIIIMITMLLVPCFCSADSLIQNRARYNIQAAVWGVDELPSSHADSSDQNGTNYFYLMDKITVCFYGTSEENISIGHVFYDEGADIGKYLYHCMAMAGTMIPDASKINLAGMILLGFAQCKNGYDSVPYSIAGDYAMMKKNGNQIIFSCMHQ